ncbi:MAG TPA: SAM-dependent methyltransferase, partial [Aggregicoccus sp.]|nr:SAM-dependent methyltransferase [Aggregicoccus sp.]
MSPDEPLPHALLPGARQAFASEDATRRFAKVARLEPGSRVLLLGDVEAAALLLARDYDCHVVAADVDAEALARLRTQAGAQGLAEQVETLPLEEALNGGGPSDFQAVLVRGPRVYRTREAAERLRARLGRDGRLGLIAVTRVGRAPEEAELARWEALQGAPLLPPLGLLSELRDTGYEPEAVEVLSPAELVALTEEAGEEASHEALRAWHEREGG